MSDVTLTYKQFIGLTCMHKHNGLVCDMDSWMSEREGDGGTRLLDPIMFMYVRIVALNRIARSICDEDWEARQKYWEVPRKYRTI
jgi:hypothetical protein